MAVGSGASKWLPGGFQVAFGGHPKDPLLVSPEAAVEKV